METQMFNPKKYAYYKDSKKKVFCKISFAATGILFIDYYLPQYGFSVIWEKKDPYIRLHHMKEIKDGKRKKTIVTFKVHPSYIIGHSFNDITYNTVVTAIDDVLNKYIKINV